jgi:tellurite resistance protein
MTQGTKLQLAGLEASKLEAVVETMLLAAHADGEFSADERAQLARSVSAMTDGQLPEAKFNALVANIAAAADSDRAARIAAIRTRLADPAICEAALDLAIRVTASDNFIRTSERELILELAEGLGVESGRAADMVAQASSK